jgi:hypothetical protein
VETLEIGDVSIAVTRSFPIVRLSTRESRPPGASTSPMVPRDLRAAALHPDVSEERREQSARLALAGDSSTGDQAESLEGDERDSGVRPVR